MLLSLLPMLKLCDRVCWIAVPRAMAPLRPLQSDLVNGAQAMEVVEPLRTLMRKAHRWDRPLFITNRLSTRLRWTQWRKLCTHTLLQHEPLRELVGQHVVPRVAGVQADRPVKVGQEARQGLLGTPILWNHLVSAFAAPLVRERKAR